MATKIVGRGYVLVHRNISGELKTSAVVSRARAEELRSWAGGAIVNVKGMPYRMAQGTLRVLTIPAEAIVRSGMRR